MNFYIAQDKARQKTKWLVLFYLFSLLFLTFVSTIVLMLLMPLFGVEGLPDVSADFWSSLFSEKHSNTFLGVGAFILGGAFISSYIESRHLAKGGSVVAARLGGVKISASTTHFNERKALNVVTEMAIASGMPVPDVYLLKNETGINAFAAGMMPSDAVIGLTQGAIDKLTRTQLQGVVGHEFSHILNGDMRLNLRIIMLLHGVAFIALLGRILTPTSNHRNSRYSRSSSSKGKGSGAIIVVGILLRLIGWLGVLLGNIVKAAVSRQREFLADASSVQFTRNPSAIGDALKVIGSPSQTTRIQKADISEVSHLFFGQAFRTHFNFIFATHPPIEQRIRRVEPHWDGRFLKSITTPSIEPVHETSAKLEPVKISESLAMLMAAGITIEHLNDAAQKNLESLIDHCKEPLEAMALVIVVLMSDAIEGFKVNKPEDFEESVEDNAKESAEERAEESAESSSESLMNSLFITCDIAGLVQAVKLQQERLRSIDLENRLPLIEIAMPALKEMSLPQYKHFQSCLLAVMNLDQQQTIYEQSVYQLISRYLDVHFALANPIKVRYKKAKQVSIEIQLVISLLAYYGHDSNSPGLVKQAFEKGMQLIDLQDVTLLDATPSNQALFQTATQKLAYCSDELKATILKGLMACIEHDGKVADIERELILAIAATLEVPISRIPLSLI